MGIDIMIEIQYILAVNGQIHGGKCNLVIIPPCVQIILTMHSLMRKKLIYLMIIFAVFQVSTNPI